MGFSEEWVWTPDFLPGFEATRIPLKETVVVPGEEQGPTAAVLVRRVGARQSKAVLYVHGWNDYFFQTHLAEYWAEQGYDFHALDLRRYGRSYAEGQLFGYTADLAEYSEELDAAVEFIAADHDQLVLMAHSTGGLISALYAAQRPGTFDALVLNSPWLDVHGTPLVRTLTTPLLSALAGQRPTVVLPLPDAGFYRRSIRAGEDGEWDYDITMKSTPAAVVRVGWLRAILRGHAEVATGLGIDCPVLVLCSARSNFGRRWSEELTRADVVLDVERIARRAVHLGSMVTIIRIENGIHDLILSPAPVRAHVFTAITRWLTAYGNGRAVGALGGDAEEVAV